MRTATRASQRVAFGWVGLFVAVGVEAETRRDALAEPVSGMQGVSANASYTLTQGLGANASSPSQRKIEPRDVQIDNLREGTATLKDVSFWAADGGRRVVSLSVGAIDFRNGRPVLSGDQVRVLWKGEGDLQAPFLSLDSATKPVPLLVSIGPVTGNPCRLKNSGGNKSVGAQEAMQHNLTLSLVEGGDGKSYVYAEGTQQARPTSPGSLTSGWMELSGDLSNATMDISAINDPEHGGIQGLIYYVGQEGNKPRMALYARFGDGQKELDFDRCGPAEFFGPHAVASRHHQDNCCAHKKTRLHACRART